MQARLDSLTGTVDELRGAAKTRFDHFDAHLTELSSSFNTMALNQQAFFYHNVSALPSATISTALRVDVSSCSHH